MPNCHRYHGTAVSVRQNVPIRNALVVQLIRSIGIRKITCRLSSVLCPQLNGLPSTTYSLVLLWTAPQWTQVNLCPFTFAAGQRFSSIVRPVSVSFDVDGQRTRRLLILRAFFLGRGRGRSNRNREGIYLEPVNDPRLGGIVG